MKKLVILSMTVTLLLSFTQLKAASVQTNELKSEIKTTKKDLRLERKELNAVREKKNGPYITRDEFYGDFGNVKNVSWKEVGPLNEATFIQNGKEMKAFYDFKSKLVGTSSMKTFADLPKKAQKRIRSEYKNYKIGPVAFFKDNEANDSDMILWNTAFDDADNYFVELKNPQRDIILQVKPEGEISFFKQL